MSATAPGTGRLRRSPWTGVTHAALARVSAAPAGRGSLTTALIAAATALALLLRVYQLTRPGMLTGVHQYDDGVYLGAAIRLADGVVPYRDFAFVQPPGIVLLLAPLGLLSKLTGTATAMAMARILTVAVGTVAVPLAGILVRRRGPLAVALSCGLLAVHPDSVYATSTLLIEPYLVVLYLLGALALFEGDAVTGNRRRLILGGLAIGAAGAVKAFAIFPAAALFVVCLLTAPWRRALRYAVGVAAGFAVLALPFIVMSPQGFFDGVIAAQYRRTDVTKAHLLSRLSSLFGISYFRLPPDQVRVAVIVVVAVVLVCVAGSSAIERRPPPALDLFALLASALTVLGFLIPRDYYIHYAAVFAPVLALSVGLAVGRLLTSASGRWVPSPHRAATVAGVAVLLAGALIVVMANRDLRRESHWRVHPPSAAFARAIPPGACVLTDKASLTIMSDRFVSNVPDCPQMVDSLGTDLSLGSADNGLTGAGRVPAVERAWLSAFRRARFVWLNCAPAGAPACDLTTNRRIPWTPPILGYFTRHFHRTGPRGLYVRDRPAPAAPRA